MITQTEQVKEIRIAIGRRLRDERHRLGLGQVEFAARCGVSKTTQFYYEGGERAPDGQYLAFADQEGVDTQYVISGRSVTSDAAEFVVIPRYNVAASCGPGAHNGEESEMRGLCFRRSWIDKKGLQPSSLKVIDVSGDSMMPKLIDGDQVLIDTSQTTPKSGFAYVLRQGDELLVKYAQLLPNSILRLSSENQTYKPYDVDLSRESDVSILGRVVASTHEW